MTIAPRVMSSFALLLLLVPTARAGEIPSGETVLLKWKVPEGEAIAFKTTMEALDPESTKVDVRSMFDALARMLGVDEEEPQSARRGSEMDEEVLKKMNEFFKSLQLPDTYSMTTVLTPRENGNLSVRMIMDPLPEEKSSDNPPEAFFRNMMKGVQLRGEITPLGKIASFYFETKQKNLLAMFFELPGRPVRVGETWSLEANLLWMGHGFICDKAQRVNRVQLASLEPTGDGDRVATLDYLLYESVEGDFMSPFGGGKKTPTTMAFGFAGRGEFLIGKGAWRRFVGHMWMKATGIMNSDTRQRFALEPMDEVPLTYLKME
ncbi:MAG TPA: hypothetical protein VFH53_07575 [Phycisphaerae bacterium]|nr:hypothetical protein [Phycisphaerae bacterium]